MAQAYLDNIEGLSKLSLPATLERGKAAPLERYYLQDTYTDALNYAKTHGAAYPYMLIAVERDGDASKKGIYYINGNPGENAELVRVGEGDVKNPALSATKYTDAKNLATAENVGQVVYVTTNETINNSGEEYSAGPYIVTGAGSLAKLGTTTATGDLAADIAVVQGEVGTLKEDVDVLKDTVGDESAGLVADVADTKADVESIKADLDGTFATKEELTALAAQIISVGGSGAINVTSEGTDLTVSLLVKVGEDGNPLKGNIKFTQSAEDGLVGEMMWNQY